jgi:hypothetical protein
MFDSEEIRLLPAELQWRTVCPKQGESLRGWVAGKLLIHTCHFVNKASRPCRAVLTKGGMSCFCSITPQSRRQIGYLPMITREREKVVMLMCATTARKASLLEHGQPVEFWRMNKSKVGLLFKVITPDEMGDKTTVNMRQMKPHDIRPYLLRVLWGDTDLVTYFDQIIPASEQDPTFKPGSVPKYSPLVRKPKPKHNQLTASEIVQGLDDAFKAE